MPKQERASWDREGLFLQEIDEAHALFMGRIAPSQLAPASPLERLGGS